MAGIPDPLPGSVPATKVKLVILGSLEMRCAALLNRARSLNLEHVSPLRLEGAGISHRPSSLAAKEVAQLSLMRRWFFARKPDAGFVLTDFPATLLQAKVFEDWLESRDEALTAVIACPGAPEPVIEHYTTLGLLSKAGDLALA